MNKYLQDAVTTILGVDPGDLTTLSRTAESIASAHQLTATGGLKSFTSLLFPNPKGERLSSELVPIRADAPRELVELANCAWRWCGGHLDHERGRAVIAVSRVEFARATLAALLWELGAEETNEGRRQVEAALASLDWGQADDVARTLWAETLPEESSGSRFMGWCESWDYSTDRSIYKARSPASEVHGLSTAELGAGIALTWIDEAMASQCDGLAFLAEAAQALHDKGIQTGVMVNQETLRADGQPVDARNREFAMKGVNAVHKKSRAAKALVRATWLSGSYPSKDKAAEAMAGTLVHYSLRTVRGWLNNV